MEFGHTLARSNRMKKELLYHGMYWVALLVIIGLEFIYRDPLLEWSVTTMQWIQNLNSEGATIFFVWVSNIGLGAPYFLAILILLISNSERGRSFYHVLFICSAMYVLSLTKMAYGESRIYWWKYSIMPEECPTDYGNPSGHTGLGIAYPLMLYLDVFETQKSQQKLSNRTDGKVISVWQALCLVGVVLYSFLMGFSRLWVRVHSWNQIVFGWQLGFWIALYFHFCIRDHVIAHIDAIMLTPRLAANRRRKFIIIASVASAILFTILVAVFLISKYLLNQDHLVAWQWMISEKCPNRATGKSRFFAEPPFLQGGGLCLIPLAAYLGLICHRVKYGRVWQGMLSTGVMPAIARFFIQILLPIPFALPLFLVPSTIPLAVQIIFSSVLPLMLAGFFLYFGPLAIWLHFNLVNLDNRPIQQFMMKDDESYGELPNTFQRLN